ncbi:type II toxin-antitoxin system Rv0910 family toxin [Mycobacterium sp. C31M]
MSEHAPVCDHPLFTYQPGWAHSRAAAVARVTRHADLLVAPDALWTVLADPRTWSDWLTVHQRWVAQPRAQFVPGARMTAETLMLGVSNTVEWTVESAIAPGTLVLIGAGEAGMRTRLTFWVSATEEGSKLTVTSEIAGDLLNDTITGAIEQDGADQLERSIALLEDLAITVRERPARPALRLVHSAPERKTVTRPRVGTTPLRAVR